MSQRVIDSSGWTYIPKNPISKAGVFSYLGSEIGAPEPNRVYSVFRPPEELEKAAASFGLIPIIEDHELIGQYGTSTDDRPPAGFTGENVEYIHPFLYAPLKITSPSMMEAINNGKKELSPAYYADWEPANGVYEGRSYEYIQRIKAGNHIALVETGRTGKDVVVLDHRTFTIDTGDALAMNLEQLLAAVAALSEQEKEQLMTALTPVSDENPEDEPVTDAGEAAEVAEEAEAVAEAAAEAVEAESKGDDVAAVQAAGEAVANAEAVLEAAEELQEQIAQDAMHKAVKHIDARNRMAAKVKPFFGVVPAAAMDSAESIAAYCLKKQGIKHGKGQAAAVITGFLHGRKPESEQVAMDSKPVTARDTASKLWGDK